MGYLYVFEEMTPTNIRVSVVIPSYNDEPLIIPFYQAVKKAMDAWEGCDYELIYVDDGSADGSRETLAKLAMEDPKITYVELWRNFGQQRALFAGLRQSKGDFVVTIDGDYQYEPAAIRQLVEAMGTEGKCELASGVRAQRMDGALDMLLSKVGHVIIRNILGINVQDYGSVKCFSRKLVDRIVHLEHHYSDVYPTAFFLHPSFVETPVDHRPRTHGRSHWSFMMRFLLYLDMYIIHKNYFFVNVIKLAAAAAAASAAVGLADMALILSSGPTDARLWGGAIAVGSFFSCVFAALWALSMSYILRLYKQNIIGAPYIVHRLFKDGRLSAE